MAASKKSDRGGGPGTYESGGVKCTLDAPFGSTGKGKQQTMSGTFNKPRSGGDNGLPTKVYDSLGGPKATPAANKVSALGTVMANRSGSKDMG